MTSPSARGTASTSDRLELAALRGLLEILRRSPRRVSTAIGDRLGDLIFDVARIRRDVAIGNLRLAFPELAEADLHRIARGCYRNFGRTIAEFARLPDMTPAQRMEGVEIIGRPYLDEVTSMGRGAILLSGHFGNWEWFGSLFPQLGHPTWFVVAEQHNAGVGALMDRWRSRLGVGILSAEKDLRGIMQALRSGGFVAILGDQDAGRDGIFVEFLGRPASTAVGPARLARRFGVPILQGFPIRQEGRPPRLELLPPILIPPDGDEDEAIRAATETWSARMEDYVRRYPDHWFWMHRRWKTQPRPAAGEAGSREVDRTEAHA